MPSVAGSAPVLETVKVCAVEVVLVCWPEKVSVGGAMVMYGAASPVPESGTVCEWIASEIVRLPDSAPVDFGVYAMLNTQAE